MVFPPSKASFQFRVVVVFLALAAALTGLDWINYRDAVAEEEAESLTHLGEHGDARAQQIAHWRSARLRELTILAASLDLPGADAAAPASLSVPLHRFVQGGDFSGAALVDGEGRLRVEAGSGSGTGFQLPETTRSLLAGGDPKADPVRLGEVFTQAGHSYVDGVASLPGGLSAWDLVGRVDLTATLWPLIAEGLSSPTTVETRVLEWDGSRADWVSPAGRVEGCLSVSAARLGDPAGLASARPVDLGDGRRCLFALRPVAHSSWWVVASMNDRALVAGLTERALVHFTSKILLILGAVAVIALLWQRHREAQGLQEVQARINEEERQRLQDRLIEAQRIGRIGSWTRDIPTNTLWWSEEAYVLFDADPSDFQPAYSTFLARVHPEDRERVHGANVQAMETGAPILVDFRVVTRDGHIRHIRNQGQVFFDEAGRPYRSSGTSQDITAIKEAELQLQRQSLYLQAVLENMPQGLSVFDEHLRLKLWNQGMVEVLELPPEAVHGDAHFSELIRYPATRGEYGPGDVDALVAGRTALAREFQAHRFERSRPSGRTHLVEGKPLFLAGRLAGFITTYTDITDRKQAEEALERKHRILQAILDHFPGGISLFDRSLQMQVCNARVREILDFPDALFADGLPSLASLFRFNISRGEYGPEALADPEKFLERLMARAARAEPHTFERVRPDGRVIEVRGEPLPEGGFVSVHTDITERRRVDERLRLVEQVFQRSPVAILIADRARHIFAANPAYGRLKGQPEEDLVGQSLETVLSRQTNFSLVERIRDVLDANGAWEGEFQLQHTDGRVIPVWLSASRIPDPQTGEYTHTLYMFKDVSEEKQAQARIHHLAHHDSLTGLPNRFTLESRLEQAMADARRLGERVAVMFLDLDRFKNINDSLGHDMGDRLLVEVARRLAGSMRDTDTVARLGGDEFVVVMTRPGSPADVALVAAKLVEAVARPVCLDGNELHTSTSVGISLYPDDCPGVEVSQPPGQRDSIREVAALMKNADTAMYHAKSAGRNNYQFFAADMNREALTRLELEGRLRGALARGELTLYFQPQVALADGGQQVVGAEALLRWRLPEGELVAPDRFIPIAEETGLIVLLGEWVLDQACLTLLEWDQRGLDQLRLSINVSARQLRNQDFPARVAELLEHHGVSPQRLELEITESAVMENPGEAIKVLRTLKDLGLRLAIDDFGTGYSSLSYLKLFPIDQLKIDRSFVQDLEHNENDRAIAFATIALAHRLGLKVVAEGVETPAQAALLRENGCDEAQGYFYSRPQPQAEAEAWIRNWPGSGPEQALEAP